jgi:hypothetical protein
MFSVTGCAAVLLGLFLPIHLLEDIGEALSYGGLAVVRVVFLGELISGAEVLFRCGEVFLLVGCIRQFVFAFPGIEMSFEAGKDNKNPTRK